MQHLAAHVEKIMLIKQFAGQTNYCVRKQEAIARIEKNINIETLEAYIQTK